mmetsp:Transcript_68819/g.119486  ORF Transcript_68819/g.119486 Transcript_68819/m.119486 type:complete len:124 (-) Transcript_68819:65-436(-)
MGGSSSKKGRGALAPASSEFGDGTSSEEKKCKYYADLMADMDQALKGWKSSQIPKLAAERKAQDAYNRIRTIGTVDGALAQTFLQQRGIDPQRRLQMQSEYQQLCMAGGQAPARKKTNCGACC